MPVRSSAAVGLLAPFQPLDVISASSTTSRSDVFKDPHCRIRQIEADMKVLQGTPEHRVEAVAIQNASVRRQRTTADPLHAFTAQAVYGSFEEQREQGAGALLDEKIDNVPQRMPTSSGAAIARAVIGSGVRIRSWPNRRVLVCPLCAEQAKLLSRRDTQPNSVEESDLRETLVAQGSAALSTTQRNAAHPGYNFPLTDS
jgi:hypothetical protein